MGTTTEETQASRIPRVKGDFSPIQQKNLSEKEIPGAGKRRRKCNLKNLHKGIESLQRRNSQRRKRQPAASLKSPRGDRGGSPRVVVASWKR